MASPGKLQERILGEARERAAAILQEAEAEAAKLRAAGSGKALAAAAKIRERGEA
jgi:vacuolar-type H+-ATPase subunit E/Vma4